MSSKHQASIRAAILRAKRQRTTAAYNAHSERIKVGHLGPFRVFESPADYEAWKAANKASK